MSLRSVQTFPLAFRFALCKLSNMSTPLTPTELADKAGISVPYASQLLSGERKGSSLSMAFRVYDATGLQLGPLTNLTATDIEAMRALVEKAKAA